MRQRYCEVPATQVGQYLWAPPTELILPPLSSSFSVIPALPIPLVRYGYKLSDSEEVNSHRSEEKFIIYDSHNQAS